MTETVLPPTPKTLADLGQSSNGTYGHACLKKVPKIAISVASTIACFADIDGQYEQMIVSLMKSEGRNVSHVLRAIKSSHERQRTIKRLLDAHLNAQAKQLVNVVEKAVSPVRDIRNRFAHGLWGHAGTDDTLLLAEYSGLTELYGAGRQLESKANYEKLRAFLSSLLAGESQAGSRIVGEDAEALFDLVAMIDNEPGQRAALSVFFSDGPSSREKATQVWTIADAQQAERASQAALNTVIGLLVCIQEDLGEADPLRAEVSKGRLLPLPPHSYRSRNAG